jgi:serine/threonine protein kinase
MRRYCAVCGRVTKDGNLWCQEKTCGGQRTSLLLDYGDMLNDVKIIRELHLYRSAALYLGQRKKQKLLVKVAHIGAEPYLRKEASFLAEIAPKQKNDPAYKAFLQILPPYVLPRDESFGRANLANEEKTYALFAYKKEFFEEGMVLSDLLLANPLPWYPSVFWFLVELADAIAVLHQEKRYVHGNINPDLIYIRFNRNGLMMPLLIDLGLSLRETELRDLLWLHRYGVVNYMAPELVFDYLKRESVKQTESLDYRRLPLAKGFNESVPTKKDEKVLSPQSDIYSLGMLLYTMLEGQAAFPDKPYNPKPKLQRKRVRTRQFSNVKRHDFVSEISETQLSDILNKALAKQARERYASLKDFVEAFPKTLQRIPPERFSFSERAWIGVYMLAITLVLVILGIVYFV